MNHFDEKGHLLTPPEYEGLVLESLGRAQVTQLKHVTGPLFEKLEASEKKAIDYLRARVIFFSILC